MKSSRADSRLKMWRFSDVSGTNSVPIFTPEDGGGVTSRNVWKPSHLDATVCPRTFQRKSKWTNVIGWGGGSDPAPCSWRSWFTSGGSSYSGGDDGAAAAAAADDDDDSNTTNKLALERQRMWNIKTKWILAVVVVAGTVWESFKIYQSNMSGKHCFKELQKPASLSTAHIIQRALKLKYKTFYHGKKHYM